MKLTVTKYGPRQGAFKCTINKQRLKGDMLIRNIKWPVEYFEHQ